MTTHSKTHAANQINAPFRMQQVARFVVVALLDTALDWAVYFAFTRLVPFFFGQPAAAKAISYAVSMLNGYLLNRDWTFESRANPWATLLPFLACGFAGTLINIAVLHAALHFFHFAEMVALVLATGTTIIWNFFTSKIWVFRK